MANSSYGDYFYTPKPSISEDLRFGCHAVYAQLCLTLCNPMDYSPLGSSVHGILQARTLEWVAIPFSRSSQSRDGARVSCVSCIDRWALYH